MPVICVLCVDVCVYAYIKGRIDRFFVVFSLFCVQLLLHSWLGAVGGPTGAMVVC